MSSNRNTYMNKMLENKLKNVLESKHKKLVKELKLKNKLKLMFKNCNNKLLKLKFLPNKELRNNK